MKIKRRVRCAGRITVLLLVYLLGVNILVTYAQSADGVVKLSDDVEVRMIAEGVWLHTTYFDIEGFKNFPANGIIVINSGEAIMVDLPWTDEQAGVLFDWVTKEQNAAIKKVVPTHWHIDCAGGLAEAHRRNAESFTLDKTVEILKVKNEPVPQNWFTERLSLGCGNISVELAYHGPAHTVDNIVAWIPARNILFGGCMVKSRNARNLGNLADAHVKSWPKTLKKVRKTYSEAKIVIPGHGRPGGLDLIDHTIELCNSQD